MLAAHVIVLVKVYKPNDTMFTAHVIELVKVYKSNDTMFTVHVIELVEVYKSNDTMLAAHVIEPDKVRLRCYVYKPGKEMHIADALSRAYSSTPSSTAGRELVDDIDVAIHSVLYDSDLSMNTLHDVMSTTDADPVLSQLRELVRHGYLSNISSLPQALRCYFRA